MVSVMQLGPLGLNALISGGTEAVRAAGSVLGGFGAQLQAALGPRTPSGAATGEGDANESAAAVRALSARIRGVLADEGVTLTEPVTIGLDAFDRPRVVGDHPDRARIEAVLATRPELGDLFRALAGRLHDEQSTGGPTGETPVAYESDGGPTFDLVVEPLARPRFDPPA